MYSDLTSIVGEQALSDDDRRTLGFVDDFERRFVGQGAERRSVEQTLDLAWDLLGRYPGTELKRIEPQFVERYHPQAAPKA
jgi:V/A-type H+-transporting ATPase subunit B